MKKKKQLLKSKSQKELHNKTEFGKETDWQVKVINSCITQQHRKRNGLKSESDSEIHYKRKYKQIQLKSESDKELLLYWKQQLNAIWLPQCLPPFFDQIWIVNKYELWLNMNCDQIWIVTKYELWTNKRRAAVVVAESRRPLILLPLPASGNYSTLIFVASSLAATISLCAAMRLPAHASAFGNLWRASCKKRCFPMLTPVSSWQYLSENISVTCWNISGVAMVADAIIPWWYRCKNISVTCWNISLVNMVADDC